MGSLERFKAEESLEWLHSFPGTVEKEQLQRHCNAAQRSSQTTATEYFAKILGLSSTLSHCRRGKKCERLRLKCAIKLCSSFIRSPVFCLPSPPSCVFQDKLLLFQTNFTFLLKCVSVSLRKCFFFLTPSILGCNLQPLPLK